ncbi:MAG: TOBE domain-containing protein, partial [Paracoccus sp. (in: a-proteobacteria)]|nr:TOBE domain-containing protein [Paracoccus sp. (in: a-proteobacteria)]
ARVVARHPDGLAELAISGGRLFLPDPGATIGARLRLRISGQELIIARRTLTGISALNQLPATVRKIRPGNGPGAVVALSVGDDVILSRVTKRSVAELGLAPGQPCVAVIKALAIAPEDIGGA